MAAGRAFKGWMKLACILTHFSLKSVCFIKVTMNQLDDFIFISFTVTQWHFLIVLLFITSRVTFSLPLTVRETFKVHLAKSFGHQECRHDPALVGLWTCVDIGRVRSAEHKKTSAMRICFFFCQKNNEVKYPRKNVFECQMVAHCSSLSQHVQFSGPLTSNLTSSELAQAIDCWIF